MIAAGKRMRLLTLLWTIAVLLSAAGFRTAFAEELAQDTAFPVTGPVIDSEMETRNPDGEGIQTEEIHALTELSIASGTEVLDLDAAGIQVDDVDALAEIIDRTLGLKEVLMFDSPLSTEKQEWLFDRYYPDIFFGFTVRIGPHRIRTDQTAFSTLHLAGEMRGDERHTSEELYPIRMCTRLRALDLGHNYLTDLNFLNYLAEIEVLIVSPNYGLEDIGPIANCKKLVYLECFNTPITDLSPLAELTSLRDLNLTRDGKITDISPLFGLKNLERVWWGNMNRVPDTQKRIMRKTHPGCKFVMVYDPTSGGWRNHSHFRELHAFFRTGEYIPFSQ